MKLCRFSMGDGPWTIGRLNGDRIVSLASLGFGGSMRALLTAYSERLADLVDVTGPDHPRDAVRLGAPIHDPQKFLAIGLNYKAHADEAVAAGRSIPTSQMWFNKQVSCIAGPYDSIVCPGIIEKLDYEGELAFVIGRRVRDASPADAMAAVAGFMVCNDVSARDWQARSPTITLGKSFDTHGPIGPWLTTADEAPDPASMTLRVTVNGEERQNSSTGDMIYPIAEQIGYLSAVMTLEPGDIVATGTPSGVGMATQSFLKPGDVVRVEISGLGYIENIVAA